MQPCEACENGYHEDIGSYGNTNGCLCPCHGAAGAGENNHTNDDFSLDNERASSYHSNR